MNSSATMASQALSGRSTIVFWILMIACTLAYYFYSQHSAILNDYVVESDTAMHSIWIQKYIGDNEFVDPDILVEVSQQIQPWGVYLMHRTLGQLMDPLQYTRTMPFLTFLLSCCIVFVFLNQEFGWKVATVGAVLMSHFLIVPTIGFNARAFAYPLLLSFLYFYSGRNYWLSGLVMILASLFYPSALLIVCGTVAVYHALYLLINRSIDLDRIQLIALGSAAAVCAVVLLAKSHSLENHPMIGGMYSKAEMLGMEELGDEGRMKILLQLAPLTSMAYDHFAEGLFPKLFLVVAIAYLGIAFVHRKSLTRLDYLLFSLMIAGLLLFVAARVAFFKLFIPVRYLEYTHLIFWYMAVIRGLSLIESRLNSRPVVFGSALVIAAYLSIFHFDPRGAKLHDYSQFGGVYDKAKTLDPQTLIAGPARVSDEIPFFAERSVLLSYKTSHLVYYRNYWPQIKQRYFDFYGAYSSSDPNDLQALIEKYSLDYIIIDRDYFSGKYEHSFEPVSRFIDEYRAGKSLDDFAILTQTGSSVIPIDDRFSLLDCAKWLSSRQKSSSSPGPV